MGFRLQPSRIWPHSSLHLSRRFTKMSILHHCDLILLCTIIYYFVDIVHSCWGYKLPLVGMSNLLRGALLFVIVPFCSPYTEYNVHQQSNFKRLLICFIVEWVRGGGACIRD